MEPHSVRIVSFTNSNHAATDMADEKEIVEKTIAEDLVVTKYKLAGEIVNRE